jgi:hypothetical protein
MWGFEVTGIPLVLMCDSADLDTSTGTCAHPVWANVPTFIPEFDATSGVAVGVAILSVWAVAYGFKKMRQAGD